MTLVNPFGIERHLHPRRSGMIVFKGGGGAPAPAPTPAPVVNVDGGLSEEQYQNLIGGIGAPSVLGTDGADNTAATGLYNEAATIGTNMDTGFAGVNTNITDSIAGVNTGVNTGFAGLTTLLDQYKTDQTNQFCLLYTSPSPRD